MVSIKNEKIERAKTYRRVMAEEKMLGNFVRLIDYIFVENLIHQTVSNTAELFALLESTRPSPDKVNKGIFVSTLFFKEAAIAFGPDEPDILTVWIHQTYFVLLGKKRTNYCSFYNFEYFLCCCQSVDVCKYY